MSWAEVKRLEARAALRWLSAPDGEIKVDR
jgi:hypothetical protein